MAKKKAKKKVVKKVAAAPTPADAIAEFGKQKAAQLKAYAKYRVDRMKEFDKRRT